MQLKGIDTSAYILIFKDTSMATQLVKEGYKHVYCLTDQKILPEYTQIKYYPYSLETHFPNNMFNVIIDNGLEDEPKDIGQFFLESYRIGMQSATIIATFGSTTKTLKIKDKPIENKKITKVNIVCNSLGLHEGIAEYSGNLKQRFEQEGVEVNLVKSLTQIDQNYPTIFEYEPGMAREVPLDVNTIIEAHFIGYPSMFIEEIAYRVKLAIESRSISFVSKETKRLMKLLYNHPEYLWNAILRSNPYTKEKLERCRLLARHPLLASKSYVKRYTLMPHIAYPKIEINQKPKDGQIRLGSFGFAVESKNFDKVCDLAVRLDVPLVLLMSINQLTPKVSKMQEEYANEIKKKYQNNKNIEIQIGFFKPEEILHELSNCSHIISAQNEAKGTSGSLRFVMKLNIPIISVDNFQAQECQVHRIDNLDLVTKEYLEKTTELTNLDDGYVYLRKVLEA